VDEESGEPTSRHVDDSVVTFNICLGVGDFEGTVGVCVVWCAQEVLILPVNTNLCRL
jgi:hypothetical protein